MKKPAVSALIVVLLLLLPLAALRAADPPAAAGKPNLVLIFIDDMGYADIGPFGNTQVRTPNLDRMAAEGRRFTSFYATPVCSMSRACMMTGCYNARVSIPGVLFPRDKIGLNLNEITLAEVVKPQGYATMCIGKWHLGCLPEFLPTRQGFDAYFGLPYSNDMGQGNKGRGFPPLPLIRNDKAVENEPDQSQLTRRYTEEAVKFIRGHEAGPFLLYLPHTMIHRPVAASERFRDKSRMGLLGDAIEEIDWSVGEILRTLKERKLDERTLVVFTSDNGPAGRPAPPFRGSKGSNFEGGVREPCIMRWPGRIAPGTACNQIAGNIDMLPTFAKLAGTAPPADRVIDGRDITSLMFDAQPGPVRDTHLYFDGQQHLAAIRQGDWKLFVGHDKGATQAASDREDGKRPGKKKKGKPAGAAAHALFNLADDPGEAKDVAADHPDVVTRLRAEAERREAEVTRNKRPAGHAAQ